MQLSFVHSIQSSVSCSAIKPHVQVYYFSSMIKVLLTERLWVLSSCSGKTPQLLISAMPVSNCASYSAWGKSICQINSNKLWFDSKIQLTFSLRSWAVWISSSPGLIWNIPLDHSPKTWFSTVRGRHFYNVLNRFCNSTQQWTSTDKFLPSSVMSCDSGSIVVVSKQM